MMMMMMMMMMIKVVAATILQELQRSAVEYILSSCCWCRRSVHPLVVRSER
jgi:hypothetical protein